jgi:hypothetical protein
MKYILLAALALALASCDNQDSGCPYCTSESTDQIESAPDTH